jgi:hypothetical protein
VAPADRSGGIDGDLHAGLAVPLEGADEVVGAAPQRDAVVAGPEHPGAPRRSARPVPRVNCLSLIFRTSILLCFQLVNFIFIL